MVPVPGIACKLLNARQASLIYNVKPLNKVRLQLRKKRFVSGKKIPVGTDPWNPDPRSATLLNRIPVAAHGEGGGGYTGHL